MTPERPHPFDLIFSGFASAEFPAFRQVLGDEPSLDRFLISEPVVEWLNRIRPDEGIGEAVDEFVALSHAAYRWWAGGSVTHTLDREATERLVELAAGDPDDGAPPTQAAYYRVAPHLIWGRIEESNHEPLDGWFIVPGGDVLQVTGCLGVHPARPGLSVMTASGPRRRVAERPDGTAPFSPTMPGGDLAGLHAIDTPDELLQLAWRAAAMRRGPTTWR